MRFIISSNIKANKHLYMAVIFLVIALFLFWVSSWILFYLKTSFSYEGVFSLYLTDPEFPEPVPTAQVIEEVHIQLFLFLFYFITLTSLFLRKCTKSWIKISLPMVFFFSGIADIFLPLAIVLWGEAFVYPKIVAFFIAQISSGIMLFMTLKLYLSKEEKEEPPNRGLLYSLVFLFAVGTLLFVVMNTVLFSIKVGFSPSQIAGYYAGDPERFIRPKTLLGMMEVIYPHTLAMSVYLFTLLHFAFFTNLRRKSLWTALAFLSALLDNFSGLGIRFLSTNLSYLKLVSFFALNFIMFFVSLWVVYAFLKHRAKSGLLL